MVREVLRSEHEILSRWSSLDPPLVSVICITYNHEKYIRDAIEGCLIQDTDFPFEVIIHDDASTDGTTAIVRAYAERYPSIIKPIYQTENQYSQGNKPITFWLPRVRGQYIALCEGDDYWHDPSKLQKQVDILETCPEVGLVHGDADRESQVAGQRKGAAHRRAVALHDDSPERLHERIMAGEYIIWTCTICARTELVRRVLDEADWEFTRAGFLMVDTPMWLELSQRCRFRYIDEPLATIRVLAESASKSQDPDRLSRFNRSCREMRGHYLAKFKCSTELRERVLSKYDESMLRIAFRACREDLAAEAILALREVQGRVTCLQRLMAWGSRGGSAYFIARACFAVTHLLQRIRNIPRRVSRVLRRRASSGPTG